MQSITEHYLDNNGQMVYFLKREMLTAVSKNV